MNSMDELRRLLRAHHGGVEPDPGFADRVVAHLAREPGDPFGWAVMRILPATLALALLLAWWTATNTPDPTALLLESPAENPLGWVADAGKAQP